jgi:hypothetical protein
LYSTSYYYCPLPPFWKKRQRSKAHVTIEDNKFYSF